MPIIVVINPKGGVGKSTLATQVAGYFASQGASVMLGDLDRQQSGRQWLALRPSSAAPILPWELDPEARKLKVPRGVTHVVLDTPAGFDGKPLREALRMATKVVVPLQASVFDMMATRDFLQQLAEHRKLLRQLDVRLVGMRVKEHTIALAQLRDFVADLPFPLQAVIRDTHNYVHLAAQGLTLFDAGTVRRFERDLAQWEPLCRWLDAPSQPSLEEAPSPEAPEVWY